MTNEEHYRLSWMTDDQWICYELLGDVHGGLNHLFGKCHSSNKGIRFNSTNSNCLSTFDYSGLTRLVVWAHDRMIRVQILPSGPAMICFVMHRRHSRDGDVSLRHPTIEDAIKSIRDD